MGERVEANDRAPDMEQRRTAMLAGLRADRMTPASDDALYLRVYRCLRNTLLSGELAPGDLINIRPIAGALGTSAMPVREALARLVAEGGLESLANRAFRVPVLDAVRYRELLLIRLRLEGLAGEHAAVRITTGELMRLRDIHDQIRSERQHSMQSYLRLNREFHFAIYEASHLASLVDLIETIWLRVGPLLHACRGPDEFASAVARHADMLDALERGDPAAAGRAVQADLIGASGMIFHYLERVGSPKLGVAPGRHNALQLPVKLAS